MTDENFLLQIEEYAKKLKANENSSENEGSATYEDNELEIDNLHQVIESFKEQLYAEKEKVKILNEPISYEDKIIESLKKNNGKEKAEESQKETKCRYWNRGYCRVGENCHFSHQKEDCQRHIQTGKCEDRKYQGRHTNPCRLLTDPV